MVFGLLALGLWGCGGGEVVRIKIVRQDRTALDANASAHFTCAPNQGTTYSCRSGQTLNQFDRDLEAGAECSYGIASFHVETSASGKVTRIQYVCATAPVDTGLPPDADTPPPAPPSPTPAPSRGP
jgi:hypothetical protein